MGLFQYSAHLFSKVKSFGFGNFKKMQKCWKLELYFCGFIALEVVWLKSHLQKGPKCGMAVGIRHQISLSRHLTLWAPVCCFPHPHHAYCSPNQVNRPCWMLKYCLVRTIFWLVLSIWILASSYFAAEVVRMYIPTPDKYGCFVFGCLKTCIHNIFLFFNYVYLLSFASFYLK